ncbi:putative membrane-associated kinase regulator 4 [Sesbania bispinosa]|nr:putative membrane-associated kinase regulator 4 [Sesbania bispinosa]
MATKQATLLHVDEDYIDIELSSSPNFFSYSIGSPPQNREFEFQMTCVSNGKDSTTSPADDLFYKGKLLPLHLPPRLQMVQKLIENSNATFDYVRSESALEDSSFLRMPSTYGNTTLDSCNISPSESCRVSSEVNPDEYSFGWSSDMNGFVGDLPKKSWPKKLKQMKQFLLGQRLKASRAYLNLYSANLVVQTSPVPVLLTI